MGLRSGSLMVSDAGEGTAGKRNWALLAETAKPTADPTSVESRNTNGEMGWDWQAVVDSP
jgi:hypothetical protein